MPNELERLKRQLSRERKARREAESLIEEKTLALYQANEERDRLTTQLQHHVSHDALTGLANRSLLRDRLQQALAYAERYGHSVWVVMLDIDQFKWVNDGLGHSSGDHFLQIISQRLSSLLRKTDTIARREGDEFVLVLPDSQEGRLSINTLLRLKEAIAQPIQLEGVRLSRTGSFGVAVYPKDSSEADTLLEQADVAMYRAKEMGRDNVQFFTAEMSEHLQDRLHLEADLRLAIERKEFVLHYQPQVDLRSGQMIGVEALLRWQHPERGLLMPGQFIALAEQTGLIVTIGEWVLKEACKQCASWQNQGMRPLRVAVNLSARQFAEPELLKIVQSILQETTLAAAHLELELTESLVMHDVDRVVRLLSDLKALGVRLSIDDFGTGYSSLSYLKRFPIDTLKIDRSFVRDITQNADDATIVRTIISLAHSLRVRVIAEGVETQANMMYLRRYGCDELQGYYFSRPVTAESIATMLSDQACLDVEQDQPPTILVVSTDEKQWSQLNHGLVLNGYRVVTVMTAQEAWSVLATLDVQIIISDIPLQTQNTSDLLRQVRDTYPDIVRILVAHHAELPSLGEYLREGIAYRCMTTPIEEGILQHTVREAFHQHDLVRRAMYYQLPKNTAVNG